jgi:hypothetical protein
VTVSGSDEGAGGSVADGGCVAPGDVVEAEATGGVATPEAFGDDRGRPPVGADWQLASTVAIPSPSARAPRRTVRMPLERRLALARYDLDGQRR